MRSDLEHLRSVFMAVENGDLGMLKSIGIKDSELGDVKFFLEKLVKTGFLDWIGIFLERHDGGAITLAVSYYNRTILSLWKILWQVSIAKWSPPTSFLLFSIPFLLLFLHFKFPCRFLSVSSYCSPYFSKNTLSEHRDKLGRYLSLPRGMGVLNV